MPKFVFTQASLTKWFEANPRGLCWDRTQRGLGCYGTSSGASLFCMFRVGARQKKKVLFRLGEGSIQQARTMTSEYLTSGRHGKDVLAETAEAQRAAQRGALTLNDAYAAYVEALTRRGAATGTLQLHDCNYRLRLAKHGDRQIASLTRGELREWHNAWGKTTGPTGANNTARMLRAILNHALRKLETDLTFNAATAIEMFAQRNKRPILALADLPAWATEVGKIPNANRRAFWLLVLFTGCRRSDAASIRLGDIHTDRLHRPSPKGGASRKFDVPMTTQLRAIIDLALEARTMIAPRSAFLFPATRGDGPYTGANCDEVLGVGCHALRRFYASACIAAGVDLLFTKSLLNHTTTGVTMNSYVSLPLAARTAAAQRAADFIEATATGELVDAPKLLEFHSAEDLEPSLA